jgi:hypothetical protein
MKASLAILIVFFWSLVVFGSPLKGQTAAAAPAQTGTDSILLLDQFVFHYDSDLWVYQMPEGTNAAVLDPGRMEYHNFGTRVGYTPALVSLGAFRLTDPEFAEMFGPYKLAESDPNALHAFLKSVASTYQMQEMDIWAINQYGRYKTAIIQGNSVLGTGTLLVLVPIVRDDLFVTLLLQVGSYRKLTEQDLEIFQAYTQAMLMPLRL